MQGWLLSSQKAVWLLTTLLFRWLSFDFHLDRGRRPEDRSTEYIGVPPPWSCFNSIVSRSQTAIFAQGRYRFQYKRLVRKTLLHENSGLPTRDYSNGIYSYLVDNRYSSVLKLLQRTNIDCQLNTRLNSYTCHYYRAIQHQKRPHYTH